MINFSVIPETFKGYYVAMMTDEYRVGFWPILDGFDVDGNVEKILELRVFNENAEHKWFRGNIGECLEYRKLDDNDDSIAEYEEAITEKQILDIDFGRSSGYDMPGNVWMSKGGRFYLPMTNGKISNSDMPCIRIKYYVPKYSANDDATIHAYVKDWRLVGFGEVR